MSKQNRPLKPAWIIMLGLSLIFLAWTLPLLLLSGGTDVLESALNLAGSDFNIATLDERTLGFLNMSMLKPVWEEVWIGIFGLYIAFNLRKGKSHAITLGLLWGIMMITNATIQGVYEVVILNWSSACVQTYLFLIVGVIAVANILLARFRMKKATSL